VKFMRHALPRLCAIALLSFTSACSAGMDRGQDTLASHDWQALELQDKPVSTPVPVTLSFTEGRASGRSGCNQYSGAVEYGAGTIRFQAMISTKMACVEDGVMQTEASYLQALQGAETWNIDAAGKLTIEGARGRIKFTPLARQTRP
jgi:heat shock protein HslJ